jgi:hypothetical protein
VAISKDGEAEFDGEYGAVFDAACAAARAEKMNVTFADPAQGLITVSAAMSAFSWGENAEIRVWEVHPGRAGVRIRSALKFGLVDWGRNKKNVDRLFGRIAELLTNPPPPPPAGWHPDPMGRHQLRYWDGASWTDHVSDAGVTSTDPV